MKLEPKSINNHIVVSDPKAAEGIMYNDPKFLEGRQTKGNRL